MTERCMLAVPTIHLNGTSKDELLGQVLRAATAVGEALEALREAAPNERDYYPQFGGWKQAVEQHGARCDRLADVNEELNQLAIAIMDGGQKQ